MLIIHDMAVTMGNSNILGASQLTNNATPLLNGTQHGSFPTQLCCIACVLRSCMLCTYPNGPSE